MDSDRARILSSVDKYLSTRVRPAPLLDYAWMSRQSEGRLVAALPSEAMVVKYGTDPALFLDSQDYDVMRQVIEASHFTLRPGGRALDFGCGIGRTLRHFFPLAEGREIWGVDLREEEIDWCRQNLSPPFHFATTTPHPRLPFEDGYFDLIYAMSVFTHINERTDSWLMELHRVLGEKGRLYVTILDEHTVDLLSKPPWNDNWVALTLFGSAIYQENPRTWARLVLEIENEFLVFYTGESFRRLVEGGFKVLSVTREAYGYQTGVLLEKKS